MDKKEKKSIYNKRYLEKQKVKQEQKVEKKLNEVQEKEDIFFLKNSMPAQPPPVPIYQYQPTQTLKQKMIETLAISSISLIPIIAKIIYSRLSIKSEPVEQHTSINLHQLPNF